MSGIKGSSLVATLLPLLDFETHGRRLAESPRIASHQRDETPVLSALSERMAPQ
jgi:hypothetical protein